MMPVGWYGDAWPEVGMSNQKGESHAVDDRCNTDSYVGAGTGERLYAGVFYSHLAGHSNRCGVGWSHPGTKNRLTDNLDYNAVDGS